MRLVKVAVRRMAHSALLAGLVALTACGSPSASGPSSEASRASSATTYGPHVVHYDGVRGARFGDTERELTARGVVVRDIPECSPRMAAPPEVSPVFVGGELALVWADPPMHTPEGIAVGDSLTAARAAYPSATELIAPTGSYRFDGLLTTSADRAYLFLHDGQKIQKLIVGYARYVRMLFAEGFAGC